MRSASFKAYTYHTHMPRSHVISRAIARSQPDQTYPERLHSIIKMSKANTLNLHSLLPLEPFDYVSSLCQIWHIDINIQVFGIIVEG
ncbi:hypothetical protein [Methanosarcina horonobensis]|uniref:hypothetical protein n=1 Tax=Methanosarcina horonobensis TaxID=418008 RepID=UPI00130164C0|nr:hypothetical protein [Methanosarcina horonobensis]